MECHRLAEDIIVKVSPKRLWLAGIKEGRDSLVKSVPDKLAKTVDKGNIFGEVGSVRTVHFHKGVHSFDFLRGTVEEVDEEKFYIKIHVVDGNLEGTVTNNYNVTLHLLEGVVKCTVECRGPREAHFLEEVLEFLRYIVNKVDAFLVENDNEYAC
eukprot:c14914_g1_i1 orf=266-730(-)